MSRWLLWLWQIIRPFMPAVHPDARRNKIRLWTVTLCKARVVPANLFNHRGRTETNGCDMHQNEDGTNLIRRLARKRLCLITSMHACYQRSDFRLYDDSVCLFGCNLTSIGIKFTEMLTKTVYASNCVRKTVDAPTVLLCKSRGWKLHEFPLSGLV